MTRKGKSMHSAGFAKQRDGNEGEIVTALEAVGCSVTRINQLGVPDLLVGRRNRTYLLEVKRPLGPKGGISGRDLSDDQKRWWEKWRGEPPVVVRSVEEALTAVGLANVRLGLYTDDDGQVRTYPRARSTGK